MNQPLRTLIVEDSESDMLLLLRALTQAGFEPQYRRVETESQLSKALTEQTWDIVISDYTMPQFDAPRAIETVRATGLDIPIIVVSGTVGEDVAVRTMKSGAHDYLLKGALTRLGGAIQRELEAVRVRTQQKAAQMQIHHLNAVLRAIRNVNQLISREKDPLKIIQQSCAELVSSRGYQAAWIAITDATISSGRMVAEQGFGDAFADMGQQLVDGLIPACCQKAQSLGGVVLIDNRHHECPGDCPMLPALDSNCKHNTSIMVATLESNAHVYGFACVAIPEGLQTDAEEPALLQEVAGDIAFALWGKEIENQRHRAEELFQLSFDNASIGKSLTAPDGTLSRINQALCNLLGYSKQELEKLNFATITYTDDVPKSQECVRCLLAGERQNYRLEKRYVRKDGHVIWADVSTILLRNGDGSPRCFITHVLDISERVAAAQALQSSEAKFRDLYDTAPNAYLSVRASDDRIVDCNLAAGRFVGRAPVDLKGLRAFDLFADTPLSQQKAQQILKRLQAGEAIHNEELQWQHVNGSVVDVSLSIEPKRDATGRLVESRLMAIDITERKRLHAQIAQSDRLASMGMLAAGVAHEINNPLAYVLYNLESLTVDLPRLTDAVRRCIECFSAREGHDAWVALLGADRELLNPVMLDDINARFKDALQGTHRIKDVARGLGTFSRVDQDRMVPTNLLHVIEVAINMVYNEIKYRCHLRKDYGKVASIMANDGRLSQVFLNLLINATHAIGEGDVDDNEICVRTWQQGSEIFAEVRDTGKGIAAEHLPHLFEPFFTTKEIGVGTGLGLSISKNIVEGYGGTLSVSSSIGVGTSFVVRLPVSEIQEHDGNIKHSGHSPSTVSGRILIVDDDSGIRTAMIRMLKNHQVVEAASGIEAQKIIEADQAFDLLLCDLMMPTMSGIDLHQWLAQKYPALAEKTLFVTGGAFTPKARDYLSKVSNIRLEKPFDVANFKKIVTDRILMAQQSTDDA